MKRPRVTTNCVADRYHAEGQRIIDGQRLDQCSGGDRSAGNPSRAGQEFIGRRIVRCGRSLNL